MMDTALALITLIFIINTSYGTLQCRFVNQNPLAYFDIPLDICINSQNKQNGNTTQWSEMFTCNNQPETIQIIKYSSWNCHGVEDTTVYTSTSHPDSTFNCHAPGTIQSPVFIKCFDYPLFPYPIIHDNTHTAHHIYFNLYTAYILHLVCPVFRYKKYKQVNETPTTWNRICRADIDNWNNFSD